MTLTKERAALKKASPNLKWAKIVDRMGDDRVLRIYAMLKKKP